MKKYLCYATILVEVETDDESQVESIARKQFFEDIETYKKDEVHIDYEEVESGGN